MLSPQRLLFMEHSLSSASNSALTRSELPYKVSTASMALPVV